MPNPNEIICLLTKGSQDAVVGVLTYPCEDLNNPEPPILIDHQGQQFILMRQWADRAFLYRPVDQLDADSLDS